jgi:hypothetical protein
LNNKLRLCFISDSTKSSIINTYNLSKLTDNKLLENRKEQILNNKEIILNQKQFKTENKSIKPLFFGFGGIIIGYIIRKEIEILIRK